VPKSGEEVLWLYLIADLKEHYLRGSGYRRCNITSKYIKRKKVIGSECLELNGCVTQADHLETLQTNMEEALNSYLDEPIDSKAIFSLPLRKVRRRNVTKVSVDPSIAFAFILRRSRLEQKWTQKETAKKLNVGLFSYQRLENSKFANPTLSTVAKLKEIFPKLYLDSIFSS